jgi:outer membrane protein assembly factor BamB
MHQSLVVGILLAAFITHAEERWPQFRGSSHGAAVSAGPTEILPEKALWKTAVPEGSSSPCIWGENLFLTAANKTNSQLETLCVDRKIGSIRWRKTEKVPTLEKTHAVNNPAAPSPATDGKTVIAYFGSFGLIAYNLDGKEIWRTPLPLAKSHMGYGASSSPIIVKDRVFVAVPLGSDSYTAAYNVADGKEIWRTPRSLYNATWSTPIHWKENGADRIGLSNAGRFIAYDWKDGKEVWFVDGVANQVCATPIENDGVIYISAAGVFGEAAAITIPEPFNEMTAKYDKNKDGKIHYSEIPETLLFVKRGTSDGAGDMTIHRLLGMMGQDKNASFDETAWEAMRKELTAFGKSAENKTSLMAVRTGGKGDVSATHLLWNESRGVPEVPSPLFAKDRIYQIKNGGILTCREAKTGKLVFEERLGGASTGGYYASPTLAGDAIYLASDTGAITIVRASDKLDVISRANLGERVQASPAIIDGNLYIRTQKHLWSFAKPN